jgi:hypothetical protein
LQCLALALALFVVVVVVVVVAATATAGDAVITGKIALLVNGVYTPFFMETRIRRTSSSGPIAHQRHRLPMGESSCRSVVALCAWDFFQERP